MAELRFAKVTGKNGSADLNLGLVNFVSVAEAMRHVKSDLLGPGGETHKKETFYIVQLHMSGGTFALPKELQSTEDAWQYWENVKNGDE